jgi:hypothetical protein
VPLPGRLQRYDSLLDELARYYARAAVDHFIAGELSSETKTPAGSRLPAGVNLQQDHDHDEHADARTAAPGVATSSRGP